MNPLGRNTEIKMALVCILIVTNKLGPRQEINEPPMVDYVRSLGKKNIAQIVDP